jgi:hypothetical protein
VRPSPDAPRVELVQAAYAKELVRTFVEQTLLLPTASSLQDQDL